MLIDFDGTIFNTDHIAAVRPSGLNSKDTVIFTAGQSAVDGGFVVHVPFKEVSRRLYQARVNYLVELSGLLDDEDESEVEEESEELSDRQPS